VTPFYVAALICACSSGSNLPDPRTTHTGGVIHTYATPNAPVNTAVLPADAQPRSELETASLPCPNRFSTVIRQIPAQLQQLVEEAQSFLERGRDVARLSEEDNLAEFVVYAVAQDLNGDSVDDAVVGAVLPFDEPQYPSGLVGMFVISPCGEDEFSLVPISGSDTEFTCQADRCSYQLIVDDIAGLGNPQVMVVFEENFTEWAISRVTIFGWSNAEWATYLDEWADVGPPFMLAIYDSDDDGSQEISITGYRLGITAGEIPRLALREYEWRQDPPGFALAELRPLPSPYRFHVLEDAQRALDSGDVHYAISLYLAAVAQPYRDFPSLGEQSSLEKTDTTATLEQTAHGYQTAFARFRLAYIYEWIGNSSDANSILSGLRKEHPQGAPGSEFADLVELLLEGVRSGYTLPHACRMSVDEVSSRFPNLTGPHGHIGDWGNSSLSYDVDTLCPDL